MDIKIVKRAQGLIRRENGWWFEHADYPQTFEQELAELLNDLLQTPTLGVSYPTKKNPHMMRVILPKSRCHVYYTLERARTLVVIQAVWGARRKRGPAL